MASVSPMCDPGTEAPRPWLELKVLPTNGNLGERMLRSEFWMR